ncbi:hypothetical protein L9F63_011760 [Diploptera punctata]|uniref:Uncharacterized protein n=1 Tax=Diploptera punctata TaxID=6984 RepID=A0AAD8EP80_DIPPU|nr:hypothetical protein L9F63_011760 [Diploptera punctata]
MLFSIILTLNSVIALPQREQYEENDPRLLRLKVRKLKLLCNLFGLASRNGDAEARTLLLVQIQQVQGTGGGGGDYGDGGGGGGSNHSGGSICNALGGGSGGGGLLGGLGGILGSPQSDPVSAAFNDLNNIRPQRYLRPIYRSLRPFLSFFKK